MDGRRSSGRTWLLPVLGALGYLAILALEWVTETDQASLADRLVDALVLLLILSTSVVTAMLAQDLREQHRERLALMTDLEAARRAGESWRLRASADLDRMRAAIDSQFDGWAVSDAERDIGHLILKGLSHKEIARLRHTSEATVRQQAQALYRKAGLANKLAFAAFFLDEALGKAPGDRPLH